MSGDDGYIQPIRAKVVAEQISQHNRLSPEYDIALNDKIAALFRLFNKQISFKDILALGEYKITEAYEDMMDTTKYMDLDDGISPYTQNANAHNKSSAYSFIS